MTLSKARIAKVGAWIIAAAFLNALLLRGATALDLPLFLDSIGTVAIGFAFGPFAGAVTGIISNALFELFHGFPGHLWPFAVVNMSSGIIAGLLARRYDLRRGATIAAAVLLIALTNALLGTIVVSFVFGGTTGQTMDYIVTALVMTGRSLFSAAFLARLPVNLVDKTIAVLGGLLFLRWYESRVIAFGSDAGYRDRHGARRDSFDRGSNR